MATAGNPLSAMPSTARASSSQEKFGASAAAIESDAEAISDSAMTALRLPASESEPATISIGANTPVVSDSDRLLAAAETPNSAPNTGTSRWTHSGSPEGPNPATQR